MIVLMDIKKMNKFYENLYLKLGNVLILKKNLKQAHINVFYFKNRLMMNKIIINKIIMMKIILNNNWSRLFFNEII
jgi:hypothetical protein